MVARKRGDDKPVFGGKRPLSNKQELATFLNVSRSLIDRLVMEREIPFIKVGRLIRFDAQAVLDALSKETR